MPDIYRIRNWGRIYEVSDAKRSGPGKALSWVAVPTKHDGKGFRRLMKRKDGMEIFGCFVLIVEVAAKLPIRGTLADDDGPLNCQDLSDKTGACANLFQKTIEVLTNKQLGINWIEILKDTSLNIEVGSPTYVRDETGRDGTNETNVSSADADANGKNGEHQKTPRARAMGAHAEVIEHYHQGYLRLYGAAYDFQKGKDGAHVKWMLEQVNGSAARLKQIFDDYLTSDDQFYRKDRHSIGLLKSQFRKFIIPEPAAAAARTGIVDELSLDFQEASEEALAVLRSVEAM